MIGRLTGIKLSLAQREALLFYALITPWLFGLIVFLAYPMLRSL
jgi:hypothetical protein